MDNTIVTTERKNHSDSIQLAQHAADTLNLQLVMRHHESLEELREKYKATNVLVARQGKYVLVTPEGELFFHPNMSQLRIKNIRMGDEDHMIRAMDLREGMSVLDCTLGFGADSIVASFVTGQGGSVVGLEASPIISFITGEGMKSFLATNYELHSAIKRVRVINADYNLYLKELPDSSVDVVYFDPMFRHPLMDSHNINPLRSVADHRPLEPEAVKEAMRVARCRVVMKENSRSKEFSRLGFSDISGGKHSKVHYGIIHI
ncbi:MAG: class I SAM-dependent methyltransferase [Anaerovibrio sp.]|uniref:class I SAM-dependent methyltransferase n=1 Tax=Anaerovibrio sp. TaxID=1872532 RepID=UPI0025F7A2D5|nr:class I SAM-dependent methyltransferase [Anaerovibrio sp.]MCR5176475.1 class I SAM-dependent methyltransferase [Anaerovibrio sp.]